MYLKSLELQGFKSFPDKTKLTFEGGSTVIVGPNGSGKSNISDAMRWVLGEVSSKSIRGTKMEDIIFGGADSRRPMGYAEVSVTFDNTGMFGRLDCPYDEVTVTRRYYRSGESEYYINRRAVRLRDIYELFMNTGVGRDGYSIIGQGKIAEIVSRKSDERRSIFEDASGIAKYRHKKSETERKLAATEDNMTRIRDVFAEVEAQVGPLEKESEKAKRAIELLETKKQVDVQLWLYDTEKLRADIAKFEGDFKASSFELQTAEDAIRALEMQNDRLFQIAQSNKAESENLLSQIREQTEHNHSKDSEYRILEANILHTRETIATTEGARISAEASIAAEGAAQAARAVRISTLTQTLDEKTAELAQAEKTRDAVASEAEQIGFSLDRALSDIRALEAENADVGARISLIEHSRTTENDKNTEALRQIEEYEQKSKSLEEQRDRVQTAVANYDGVATDVTARLAVLEEELTSLEEERQEKSEAHTATQLQRDSIRQRIETVRAMEQQFEGYAESVRYVMKQYEKGEVTDRHGAPCGKIYGPLSKLITVEDRYLTAIETALGPNLQHIVVEDESVAKAAMHTLKRAEAGRATFFPLTSMRPQTATQEMNEASGFEGYVAVADELLRCDAKFSDVVSSLLGRTLIFDTIDHATTMAKALRYRVRAVTLDGQQINVGGSFTGGSVHKGRHILGRAGQIKRLEEELATLEKKLGASKKELDRLQAQIDEREEEKDSEEQKLSIVKVMRESENTRLEQILAQWEANRTLTEKLRADYGQMLLTHEQYEEDLRALNVRQKELAHQIEEIGAARADMDVRRHDALDRKAEIEKSITDLLLSLGEVRKDIETERLLDSESEARMAVFLGVRAEHEQKKIEMENRIAELERECAENRERFAEGEEMLRSLNEQRARVEAGSSEFEKKLADVNVKMRERLSHKENIFREHTRLENRLTSLREDQDKLVSKLWDEHEMTRSDALALGYPVLEAATRAEAAQKQTECRNKLRVLGNVDLDAVNKYKEIKQCYDYMAEQIRDLETARDELSDVIHKLESEMETAFVDSFQKINENFNRVFGELFGGGSAELSLTDPDNVLESGIEIKAAPPGKIIKSLVQLSGGEQSFIAIALFFAILQVNPTPFCILDEIEAALDEVNVARFAEYIKRYASETQFILITHRRGTMEAANRLYGVTMPERGISKVLELDVGDISKKKGEDWDGIFG